MRVFKSLVLILLVIGTLKSCKEEEPVEPVEPVSVQAPSVETAKISNIEFDKATSGGIIIDEGGATVTSRGVCWSLVPMPTINDEKTSDASGDGAFVSKIEKIGFGLTYYVRAYATNKGGTAYGLQQTFETPKAQIGDSLLGGYLAYILEDGDNGYTKDSTKGMIVNYTTEGFSKNPNETEVFWGCENNFLGTTLDELGYGMFNTSEIIRNCTKLKTAAQICVDFQSDGFDDWFLPSVKELSKAEENVPNLFLWNSGRPYFPTFFTSTEVDAENCFFVFKRGVLSDNFAKSEKYGDLDKSFIMAGRYFSFPK